MINNSSLLPDAAFPLSGEVDIAVAAEIGRQMTHAAEMSENRDVEVDCTDLIFIDASGITMLMNVETHLDKRVRLFNVTPPCRRVFEVLSLCEHFGLEPGPTLHLVAP